MGMAHIFPRQSKYVCHFSSTPRTRLAETSPRARREGVSGGGAIGPRGDAVAATASSLASKILTDVRSTPMETAQPIAPSRQTLVNSYAVEMTADVMEEV